MSVRRLAHGLLLCCPLLALAAGTPPPPKDKFEAGVEAYRAGDYAAALAAFLEAQPAGTSAANLQFNLGLTYYKLRRYDEARLAFEHLRQYPGYAAIADYHLGLIAAQLGEREQAQALWQPLASSAPEQALRDRTRFALNQISPAPTLLLTGAAGYDTNPALLDEGAQPVDSAAATVDVQAALEHVVSHTAARDYALRVSGYAREYSIDNGLDQAGVFGSAMRSQGLGDHDLELALDAGTSFLHGHHFLDSVAAGATAMPRTGASGLAWSAQLTRYQAPAAFDYLEGWRLRVSADWLARAATPWRLGAVFEANDRTDLEVPGAPPQFYSHSPLRQGINFLLPRSGPWGWNLQAFARYRYSWYRDPDVFLVNGTPPPVTERRVDHLLQAGLRARRRLGRGAYAVLEYEFSRNDSTIDAFTYDRHVLQAGVEWTTAGR